MVGRQAMRNLLFAQTLTWVLGGCTFSRGAAPPEAPRVTIPASLTAPCIYPHPPPTTNGELLEAYGEALWVIRECDKRIQSIRTVTDGR
jgi:hypothetical protein